MLYVVDDKASSKGQCRAWFEHGEVSKGVLLHLVHIILTVALVPVVVLVTVVRYVVGDLLLLAYDNRLKASSQSDAARERERPAGRHDWALAWMSLSCRF